MNEYYKIRFNITKYFLNLDIQLSLLKNLIYVVLILSSVFIISIYNYNSLNIINLIIYIIHLLILLYTSYEIIKMIDKIKKDETLNKYNDHFELLNCIFKENLDNTMTIFKTDKINDRRSNLYELYKIKDELIIYINNIENVYKTNDVNILLTSTPDIMKYYDVEKYINNNFDKHLYIPSNSKFNNDRYNNYLKQDNDDSYKYLDLELLNKYPIKSEFLNYLNKKYNKEFTQVYLEPPFLSPLFNVKINKIIDDYKWSIYNYLITIGFFIFIILHSLYLSYNINIVYIYIITIILSILLLFIL